MVVYTDDEYNAKALDSVHCIALHASALVQSISMGFED